MLPALAIAESLRGRDVGVTFAGRPDGIEARLVAEAGFELDAFRVRGFPRRPGLALARAERLGDRERGQHVAGRPARRDYAREPRRRHG
ncbi:MAG TPA: hypothetical protein VG079_02265 [Gaiellaceae bacterium]|nr:hypothetical protein [Gaiellaceae bacterium]